MIAANGPQHDEIGAERRLALHYVPAPRRGSLEAVWRLDARMRDVFSRTSEPAVAEIKLAWWQERLDSLVPRGAPAEPLLRSLAAVVAAVPGTAAALPGLAECWRELGGTPPWLPDALDAYARLRGRSMIDLAAGILDFRAREPERLAGEAWALSDLALLTGDTLHRAGIVAAARARFAEAGRHSWPRRARPVGMMVMLSRGDIKPGPRAGEGSPSRVARMAWHALTGR